MKLLQQLIIMILITFSLLLISLKINWILNNEQPVHRWHRAPIIMSFPEFSLRFSLVGVRFSDLCKQKGRVQMVTSCKLQSGSGFRPLSFKFVCLFCETFKSLFSARVRRRVCLFTLLCWITLKLHKHDNIKKVDQREDSLLFFKEARFSLK